MEKAALFLFLLRFLNSIFGTHFVVCPATKGDVRVQQ